MSNNSGSQTSSNDTNMQNDNKMNKGGQQQGQGSGNRNQQDTNIKSGEHSHGGNR